MPPKNLTLTPTAPGFDGVAVTPHDVTNLTNPTDVRALYIGGAGDVSVEQPSGTVIYYNAQAGQILPIQVSRVNSTNTTATNINALY